MQKGWMVVCTIKSGLPAVDHPYMFDGITEDEKCFEACYLWKNIEKTADRSYKPLIKQLLNGEVDEIPVKYMDFTPSHLKDPSWKYTKETFLENHPRFHYPL